MAVKELSNFCLIFVKILYQFRYNSLPAPLPLRGSRSCATASPRPPTHLREGRNLLRPPLLPKERKTLHVPLQTGQNTTCSVKTLGRYLMLWPRPLFKVAICDLERFGALGPAMKMSWISASFNGNMKFAGKRILLRFTCSFNRFVGTPYNSARSRSSITCTPRIVRIRDLIESSSKVGTTAFSSLSIIHPFPACADADRIANPPGKVATRL